MPSNEFVCRSCHELVLIPTPPEEMFQAQRDFVADGWCGEALAGVD